MKKYNYLTALDSKANTPDIEVTNPYTDDLVATVSTVNQQQTRDIMNIAYDFYRDKNNWLPLEDRVSILEKVSELMEHQFEHLVNIAVSEGGKPITDTRVEVRRAIAGIKSCIETITTEHGEVIGLNDTKASKYRAFTQKEPIGVVLAISAFNHPLNLIVHQVGAAVAAGCPVIVKPAEQTPLSCYEFVKILIDAGFPKEMCQIILPNKIEYVTEILQDTRLGFLSFIGSAAVGWKLRSLLAPGVRCALEHGGVAPVIVDDTASLEKAIPSLVKGAFYHAGQVCVSVQRIFAHETVYPKLIDKIVDAANKLRVGDPSDENTEVGPLISAKEQDRVNQWVQESVAPNKSVLKAGGKVLANNCFQATVLADPDANCAISTKEIFGPVCAIYAYADESQAIAMANKLPYAFQAGVFSQDIDNALRIADKLDASAVMINDNSAFRQDQMPFAGLRQSGLGVGGIPHTVNDMQIDKMVVINTPKE